ncbi:MAG: FAD-binding protein [Saprospiraceae bacterium]|nr:FAD-binding protein [Saprospiraceae bacterium]
MTKPHTGFNAADFQTEYAPFFDAVITPVPLFVADALAALPLPWGLLPDISDLSVLEKSGYQPVESGYSVAPDGSMAIAVHTPMPGVDPRMWAWWFGWHGSQDRRYKLWHPGAHVSARWQDGRNDHCYIGRTSLVKEYIGDKLLDAAVQFKSPLEFGLSFDAVNHPEKVVYICAKIGHPSLPIDYGYLVHQVRAVEGGAEMRSRFWLGGKYVSPRQQGKIESLAVGIMKKIKSLPKGFGRDMLRHCSEEMNHLAAFLPALYQKFASEADEMAINGNVARRGDADFDATLMSTLFNKIDPGQRPSMIFEPHTVEDVIRIVRYAKRTGKRITVSSGGHSFSANFVREDALLVLMKHFNQYEVNKDAMTAQAGPGVGGSVLMEALFRQQLFFPAGHCKGVCIGGYLLQGGYGWNGRKMGIACQYITAMDIVTADGELVHANTQQYADLFWAARGSGPGFFGIVVRFYLQVFPLPPYRAIMAHDFGIEHLEDVYRWAYDIGPDIPKAVEFQLMMSKNMLNLLGPGIEALAPIFADTKEEFEAAKSFMLHSPIRKKAKIVMPAFNPGIDMLYKATMSHYPSNYHYGVDNMWTHADIDSLLPYVRKIADTLPPAPSHFLWLNWQPDSQRTDMAYSKEDKIYLALYSCWKNSADTPRYANWAPDLMREMQHLSSGIQLADEGLHKRAAAFMSPENLQKVQEVRGRYDPTGVFFEWHSKL